MTEKALRSAVAEIWKMSLEFDACLCLTDRKELDELHRRAKNAAAGYLDLLAAGCEAVTGLPREGEPCKLLALRLPQRLQLAALFFGAGSSLQESGHYSGVNPYVLLPAEAWDLFDGRAEVAFDARTRACCAESAKWFAFYLPRWMEGGAAQCA